jgi:hypothetical protein
VLFRRQAFALATVAAMVTPADKERPHHRFRIGRVFQIHFAKQV